jgi:DNA uptake protein ComE-like DNA-binding protein
VSIVLWVVAAIAPFGIGVPVLFATAAHRTGKRGWYAAAALWGVLSWGGIAVAAASPDDSTGSTIGGLMILLAWIGGAVHAFVARGEYNRRLRSPAKRAIDAARDAVEARREAQRLAAAEPEVALQMGVGRPDVTGSRHLGVVDLNRAGVEAIEALPGITRKLAREIVRAREQIDGFASLEDMGMTLHLDGGVVEDLRPYVVFLPR